MKGLIMDYPLTLTQLFERSRKLFHRKTMATRVPGTGLQRYTYADYAERVCRLSAALAGLGLKKGDRVGTFAWNSHRHMEVYFAAPLMGMVLHTVNIRLSPQDLTYIINHAEDQVLIVDASLWPLLEPIRKDLKSVKHVIVMKDAPTAEIPEGPLLLVANEFFDASRPGPPSARPTPRACATPRGRPGIPRACSTLTAGSTCTASARPRWTCSASASAT